MSQWLICGGREKTSGNIRLLSKLASGREFEGGSERRTESSTLMYMRIPSTESTELRWISKNQAEMPTKSRSVLRMFEKWLLL